MAEITFGKDFPFTAEGEIREFHVAREDKESVWHCDAEDREIEVLNGEGWQFQYENCLPYHLKVGMIFDVPQGEYHRLIKGYNNLTCRVIKNG